MSASNQIKCPHCKRSFEMSTAVEEHLRSTIEKEFEDRAEKERDILEKDRAELRRQIEDLATQRTSIEKEVGRRLEANRKTLEASAREAANAELTILREEMEAQATKLNAAQKNEVELRKQQRELEREKNEFQLKLTREIDSQRQKIVEETSARVADEYAQKELEWNKRHTDMIRQVEELQRKASVGSQQLQGEALEIEIESILKDEFKHDSVEPVAKGVTGADIALHVCTRTGQKVGVILFELKRTKSFSAGWLPKLREDQRAAKADVAVLITAALPDGVKHIGQQDGIWISDIASFLGLAQVLRTSLIEVAQARQAQAGRKTKSEEVYEYLQSAEFKGRISGLIESFITMREGIELERRAFEKIWSRREKEVTRALTSTSGFYGDLQGLISLQEIPCLSLEVK